MVDRPRHPKKDIELIMRAAEAEGWVFEKRRKYFFGKCSCGLHMKTVHLTPSGSGYGINLAAWFRRLPCWGTGGGRD